jgi:sugar phosphate isomerase/epimerase
MAINQFKICAKGSRKIDQDFLNETEALLKLANCIEIDFNFPHDTGFKKEIKYLEELHKNKKVNFTAHAQYLNGSLNDYNQKIRKETIREILNSIDLAQKIGAKIMTLHPALEPYGLKTKKRINLEINAYQIIADYAVKKNMNIGLENEAQTCFWFPDRACKINLIIDTIKKVNRKNFGLTLDIGHANISGEDYIKALNKYHNKILHIHAHDNFGNPEKNLKKCKRPDPHLPPGKGVIDWRGVMKTLRKIKYKKYFELECEISEIEKAIKYINTIK